MSAIERCRTAALGGHVERCEDCAYRRICYNSCRNRHCPKCQAAAAKQWLADRQAELLPVPYFHVVFTLPGSIADIANQNKAIIYDLLLKVAAETVITMRPRKLTIPSISAPVSGSPPCSTPGDQRLPTIRTPISLYPAAACRPSLPRRKPGAGTGLPADPASFCRCGCSHACSAACSWRG